MTRIWNRDFTLPLAAGVGSALFCANADLSIVTAV